MCLEISKQDGWCSHVKSISLINLLLEYSYEKIKVHIPKKITTFHVNQNFSILDQTKVKVRLFIELIFILILNWFVIRWNRLSTFDCCLIIYVDCIKLSVIFLLADSFGTLMSSHHILGLKNAFKGPSFTSLGERMVYMPKDKRVLHV